MEQDFLDSYLPKTKLDYAIEYVEHKYSSLRDAPMHAIRWIRLVGLNGKAGRYATHKSSSERIPKDKNLSIRIHDKKLFTNSKFLISTCRWINDGKPIRLACELGGFSYAQFNKLNLVISYYIYSYKKIHFKFYTYEDMFKDLKAMKNWTFAPTSYFAVKHHEYLGKIRKVSKVPYKI